MRSILFLLTLCTCYLNSTPIDLSLYEKGIYSQNGEDGILAKLFQQIPAQSKFCVEFGAFDGVTGSNTYMLRLQGWNSLLLDRAFEQPEINLYKAFITADNINQLFDEYNVPHNLDLLSIDIDFNDFYVWHALDAKYSPSVVVIEYNGTHFPDEDKVVPYRPFFCGGGSNYYGASILALYHLARAKGYSLVYAEESGTNLFFVRDDLIEKHGLSFLHLNDVEKIYRKPTYGTGPNGGHLADLKNRKYLTADQAIDSRS